MSRRRRYGRRNPLTTTEDLLLAGLGVGIVGLIGYAIWSKNQTSTNQAPPNPYIATQPSQTAQEAYDNWAMQQINAGIFTPQQVSS